ncbi:MAG: hypothetical protein J7K68_03435 [Candidatus Diapherotrites archaeon]|nr:hypothetical protein [Candidatus Diapherotrites archaeon]
MSIFWPFGVMAQETQDQDNFCDISNALNVTELNYYQATAIQGIVTQDVATSAEHYRQQQALEKLGIEKKTKQQQIADDYNFYFMGADGPVFYYKVLGDRLQKDNGWLIGTNIDGRIEYGGHLRENLAICGQSPVNASDKNVCVRNGDVDKTKEYIDSLRSAKTKADIISTFVSLSPEEELLPSDLMDLSQSRVRGTEFTTSMATGGPGTTIFILPQALTMYTAAMKKLDMADMVIAIVGLGSVFKNAGAYEGSVKKGGLLRKFKQLFGGKTEGDMLTRSARMERLSTMTDDIDDVWDGAEKAKITLTTSNKKSDLVKARAYLSSTSGKFSGYADNMDELSKILDDEIKYVDDTLLDRYATAVEKTKDQVSIDEAINWAKSDKVPENIKKLVTRREALVKESENFESLKPAVKDRFKEIAELIKKGEVDEAKSLWEEMKTGMKMIDKYDNVPVYRPVITANGEVIWRETGEVIDNLSPSQYKAYIEKVYKSDPLLAATIEKVAKAHQVTGAIDDITELAGKSTKYASLQAARDAKNALSFSRLVEKQGGILKTLFKPSSTLRVKRAVAEGTATFSLRVFNTLIRTIYTGIGTKAIAIARALHYVNDYFLRKGYFEVTGSGLTLHYSKEDTGIFKDDSVIVIMATNSIVRGITKSYLGGELGTMFMDMVGQVNKNLVPLQQKANALGDVLVFGGVMYPPRSGVIIVEKEKPRGMTKIDEEETSHGRYYILRIRNWENHQFTAIEDPRTMAERSEGEEKKMLTAMGMWTYDIDLYAHLYGDKTQLSGVFTVLDPFVWKIGSWGLFSKLFIASSAFHMFLTPTSILPASKSLAIMGMPLGMYATSKYGMLAGKEFMTSELTDMDKLAKCIEAEKKSLENETSEYCAGGRPSCYNKLTECMQGESLGSAGLAGATMSQYVLAAGGPAGAAVMLGSLALSVYKMQLRKECLNDLATCQEQAFTIIGVGQYSSPEVLAAEQQTETLKGLPGLEELPVKDFLEASGLQNVSIGEITQQQLNIHTEMENASGRMAFDEIYYAHISDATIQWIESNLPIDLCNLDENGNPVDKECVEMLGNDLRYGGKTIVSDELVPFKWMDTELPAIIIPNTAVTVDTGAAGSCTLVGVDNTGERVKINPSVVSKFESLGFQELERMFGKMRVIETKQGAIYPTVDYDGNYRLEMDNIDGNFLFSTEGAEVLSNGKVRFNNNLYDFESAVFTGGTIVKRGNLIYVLPKYFMPVMSGKRWLEATGGAPFVSDTGEPLEVYDAKGNLLGLDAKVTRIPGGEKLGIITRVDAEKDLNGDGEISDDEKAGWRFYRDPETNKSKFELFYKGKKEIYDADQVEIDEKTGDIKVYEKGKPHVEANLLRTIETKVDSLGRTLLTIKDGKGNTLLEEALVTYLKGSGGAIKYDKANNNYVFVNGQPVEVNNNFKTNGFNPITGRTEPPLLQPTAIDKPEKAFGEEKEIAPPALPTRPESGIELVVYLVALITGLFVVRMIKE